MVRVIISDPAILDIDDIKRFIGRNNAKIAKIFIQKLFKKIDLLKKFPELGRVSKISHRSNIRTILHHSY